MYVLAADKWHFTLSVTAYSRNISFYIALKAKFSLVYLTITKTK